MSRKFFQAVKFATEGKFAQKQKMPDKDECISFPLDFRGLNKTRHRRIMDGWPDARTEGQMEG